MGLAAVAPDPLGPPGAPTLTPDLKEHGMHTRLRLTLLASMLWAACAAHAQEKFTFLTN